MSRVVFLHGSNDMYGASRVLLGDVRIVSDLGASVEVLLPYEGPLSAHLADAKAKLTVRPLRVLRRVRRASMLEWPVRLPFAVRHDDVVVLWTLALLPYLPVFKTHGTNLVISVHELPTGRMGGSLARLASLSTGPAMANSAATGKWLVRNGWDPARIRLAYPVVDDHCPLPRPPVESPLRILLAGRVSGAKGHLEAVDAVQVVRDRGVDAELTLAGAPFPGQEAHLQALIERIAGLPWARYVGEVPDLRVLLADHHALLMASLVPESFGLVLLEAWAAGRRAVAPDEGGAAEAARLVDGVVYPARDQRAMVSALMLIAEESVLRAPPANDAPVASLCTVAARRAVWHEILATTGG